jgi:hypothetical protein
MLCLGQPTIALIVVNGKEWNATPPLEESLKSNFNISVLGNLQRFEDSQPVTH